MNAVVAIVDRELRDKKSVFIAAALLGLLPPFLLFLGNFRGWDRGEVAAFSVGVVSLCLALAVGAAAGASMLSRELSERRMGFYFVRPVSTAALWGGKFIAAILLPLLAAAIPVIISVVLGVNVRDIIRYEVFGGEALGPMIVFTVCLVLLTSAASTAVRARSGWLALQMISFIAAVLIAAAAARPLLTSGSIHIGHMAVGVFLTAVPVALLVASFVGFARGRTEIVAVQRNASIAFAAVLIGLVILFSMYTLWLRSADRGDLTRFVMGRGTAAGSAVVLLGKSAGRGDFVSSFVYDVSSARELKSGAGFFTTISRDGRRAAWPEPLGLVSFDPVLAWTDLTEERPQVRTTTIHVAGREFFLSPDGSTVLVIDGRTAALYELATERQIAAAPIPWTRRTHLRVAWPSAGVVRLYVATPTDAVKASRQYSILEYSPGAGGLKKVGAFTGTFMRLTADEKTLVIFDRAAGVVRLADPYSGATRVEIATPNYGGWATVGQNLAIASPQESVVNVYDFNGRLQRRIGIPNLRAGLTAGPLPNTVVARVSGGSVTGLWTVDVTTGKASKLMSHALPVARHLVYEDMTEPAPGAPVTRLFETEKSVFVLDPVTGKRRAIAGQL